MQYQLSNNLAREGLISKRGNRGEKEREREGLRAPTAKFYHELANMKRERKRKKERVCICVSSTLFRERKN